MAQPLHDPRLGLSHCRDADRADEAYCPTRSECVGAGVERRAGMPRCVHRVLGATADRPLLTGGCGAGSAVPARDNPAVGRRLFNVLAVLSLLLCAATCVLWVRDRDYVVEFEPVSLPSPTGWRGVRCVDGVIGYYRMVAER